MLMIRERRFACGVGTRSLAFAGFVLLVLLVLLMLMVVVVLLMPRFCFISEEFNVGWVRDLKRRRRGYRSDTIEAGLGERNASAESERGGRQKTKEDRKNGHNMPKKPRVWLKEKSQN